VSARVRAICCGDGSQCSARSSSWLPSCPPAPGPHPRQGHTRLAARLCRDRADYAACLERWPDARTGATVTCVSALKTSSSRYRTSATCCARPTATRSRSSAESPSRLRRPHSAGTWPCRYQSGPAGHPVSLGCDSSGISRTTRYHPRKSGGRDLAEVAPADLPINPLGTVRPHPGI
jgi:hypothetical protein